MRISNVKPHYYEQDQDKYIFTNNWNIPYISLKQYYKCHDKTPSEPCEFEGKVIGYEVIKPDSRYILKTLLISRSDRTWCDGVFRNNILEGYWYPPTSVLPSGELYKPNQPKVDISQVLTTGSVISGHADSYDSTIQDVVLLSVGESNSIEAILSQVFFIVGLREVTIRGTQAFDASYLPGNQGFPINFPYHKFQS